MVLQYPASPAFIHRWNLRFIDGKLGHYSCSAWSSATSDRWPTLKRKGRSYSVCPDVHEARKRMCSDIIRSDGFAFRISQVGINPILKHCPREPAVGLINSHKGGAAWIRSPIYVQGRNWLPSDIRAIEDSQNS